MSRLTHQMLRAAATALQLPAAAADAVELTGAGDLPSCYGVSELATASIATAVLAIQQLMALQKKNLPPPRVDRRLASLWFGWSIHPQGWERPPLWDAVAGDYACADGWIRLHTNAPRHRQAALAVLSCVAERRTGTRTA